MRTLSDNTASGTNLLLTSPGYLAYIGFELPLYLSSRGSIIWNDATWNPFNFSVAGMDLGAAKPSQTGTITVQDSDGAFGALVLDEGVADRSVTIWKFYGEDPADDDPVVLFDGVCDSSAFSDDGRVSITMQLQRSNAMMCPRRTISRATGFNFLPPAGTIINWGGEQFVLKGSDQ